VFAWLAGELSCCLCSSNARAFALVRARPTHDGTRISGSHLSANSSCFLCSRRAPLVNGSAPSEGRHGAEACPSDPPARLGDSYVESERIDPQPGWLLRSACYRRLGRLFWSLCTGEFSPRSRRLLCDRPYRDGFGGQSSVRGRALHVLHCPRPALLRAALRGCARTAANAGLARRAQRALCKGATRAYHRSTGKEIPFVEPHAVRRLGGAKPGGSYLLAAAKSHSPGRLRAVAAGLLHSNGER
jgi:hypothetical protein